MVEAGVVQPWYRALTRTQWNTLLASNLGWVFDGFEAYALILTVGVALRQLLDPVLHAQIPAYAGAIIATTLCGWAIGGMTAGVLADYIGRKRTMILAILCYSLMTGLSAFAWDWVSFAVMRFLVGLASEHMGDRALTRFTFAELFADPETRRRAIIAFLMATSSAVGFWGISSWIPPYIGSIAAKAGLAAPQWASITGMVYNVGAIVGYIGMGFLADAYGRRPITLIFFALSLVLTPAFFLLSTNLYVLLFIAALIGCFASGQFTWMSAWLPELFPTRVRATAVGFIFNGPRFLAAIGTLVSGTLIVKFGGYGNACMIVATIYILALVVGPFLPETNGKPLPE
jgi:MFS family permease